MGEQKRSNGVTAIAMAFKMLDGKARGDLQLFKPEFGEPLSLLNQEKDLSEFNTNFQGINFG